MKKTFLINLFAVSIVALFVMPTAFASGASLRQQVKSLKQRVAALEGRQTTGTTSNGTATARPSGPAGGDLAGTYPNPTIGPDAVTGAEVKDASLTGTDIVPNTIFGSEIAPDSVFADDLRADSVGDSELAPGSVGTSELKQLYSVVNSGVQVNDGSTASTSVTCGGARLIAGGYAWTRNADGLTVTQNAPATVGYYGTWTVTGVNKSGSSAGLYAWATCLPA
jgi:hypothetical protein